MVANTLYFVYAQLVTGVPVLRISASVPSVYLISNPTAKLVTAFYSNRLAVFGSFNKINSLQKDVSAYYKTTNTPTSSPAVAINTLITLSFPTIVQDTEGNYNTSTGEYTVSVPAYYDIEFVSRFSGSFPVQGNIEAYIYINGSQLHRTAVSESGSSSGEMSCGVRETGLLLAAGDIITFRTQSSQYTTLVFLSGATDHWFQIKASSINLPSLIKDL
jgi:hypothetical protein